MNLRWHAVLKGGLDVIGSGWGNPLLENDVISSFALLREKETIPCIVGETDGYFCADGNRYMIRCRQEFISRRVVRQAWFAEDDDTKMTHDGVIIQYKLRSGTVVPAGFRVDLETGKVEMVGHPIAMIAALDENLHA